MKRIREDEPVYRYSLTVTYGAFNFSYSKIFRLSHINVASCVQNQRNSCRLILY